MKLVGLAFEHVCTGLCSIPITPRSKHLWKSGAFTGSSWSKALGYRCLVQGSEMNAGAESSCREVPSLVHKEHNWLWGPKSIWQLLVTWSFSLSSPHNYLSVLSGGLQIRITATAVAPLPYWAMISQSTLPGQQAPQSGLASAEGWDRWKEGKPDGLDSVESSGFRPRKGEATIDWRSRLRSTSLVQLFGAEIPITHLDSVQIYSEVSPRQTHAIPRRASSFNVGC